jgi:hypothetical protein
MFNPPSTYTVLPVICAFLLQACMPASTVCVCRAIINSSFVGMTHTVT